MGALLIGAIVIAELPPAQRAASAIERHRTIALTATVSIGAGGFLVFMGGVVALVAARGAPTAAGREAHVETSVAAMIAAWRSGEWRRDPEWRRVFVITAGASAFAFGMLASFIVAGPPHVKVLVGAALLYAIVMTVRGVRLAARMTPTGPPEGGRYRHGSG
jgi:hypothetical protein